MLIKTVRGFEPLFGKGCYFAENATLVGDVVMGKNCSVWFQAVIRGDVNSIRIGDQVNIQDGAVIHATFGKSFTVLEDRVSIGHNAIVHGAHICEGALIGMSSVVMDNVVVGAGAVVAAGAVVLEGTQIPPGMLYAGVPAKQRGEVRADLADHLSATADRYVEYADWFRGSEV